MAAAIAALTIGGCSGGPARGPFARATTDERECLVRAMYFESNRSSFDGSMAVGTVVMNRVESRRFPNTICGVVGQHRQFASGVLTKPMDPKQMKTAVHAADAILKGHRYAPTGKAMHFHAASYKNPHPAMYVAVAGGNAFYLKPGHRWQKEYTGSVETAKATPVKNLYQKASAMVAAGPAAAAAPCEAGDEIGAISLACETELAGR